MTDRSVPFGRPWITDDDRKAVMEVLDSPILTHGPQGEAFEREFEAFAGGGTAVALSSCGAALLLSYVAMGIGPGDEVIVPAQTHVATAHAVVWAGATPVFVDCDPATGNVRAEDVERAVTPRTRAVSVVHFVGIPCDMPAIVAVARAHGLRVVEDCALALGTRWEGTHAGLFGDAGCFSFYPVKHITTGEGGMLLTRDPEIADSVRRLRGFGVDRAHGARAMPGVYDVPSLGLNFRMSEIQAALGRTQLARADEALERREESFDTIASALRATGLRILDETDPSARSSRYCLSVMAGAERAAAVEALKAAGIGTSVYYPHPVPRLAYYRGREPYDPSRFANAAAISDRSVALPVGVHVSAADARYIAERAAEILGRAAR